MKYIALLRGINIGGKRKIIMADLRKMFEDMGFTDVKSYIQTGNVIFSSDNDSDQSLLSTLIAKRIEQVFGFDVPVIVRSAEEIEAMFTDNPFLTDPDAEIDKLHVVFLNSVPDIDNLMAMSEFDFGDDRYMVMDNNLYLFCSGPYRETKLGNNFIEKKLKVTASTRTWKTVIKLKEMM